MGQLELTIEVRHADLSYTAQIVGTDVWELEERITEARTLSELPMYLEEAIQLCLDDDSARLVTPALRLGTLKVTVERDGD